MCPLVPQRDNVDTFICTVTSSRCVTTLTKASGEVINENKVTVFPASRRRRCEARCVLNALPEEENSCLIRLSLAAPQRIGSKGMQARLYPSASQGRHYLWHPMPASTRTCSGTSIDAGLPATGPVTGQAPLKPFKKHPSTRPDTLLGPTAIPSWHYPHVFSNGKTKGV